MWLSWQQIDFEHLFKVDLIWDLILSREEMDTVQEAELGWRRRMGPHGLEEL